MENRIRILLIDDDEFNVKRFQTFFQSTNVQLVVRPNATSALRDFQEIAAPITLVRALLADRSGIELAGELKLLARGQAILLLNTAFLSHPRQAEILEQSGIDGLVPLPLQFGRLEKQINAILAQKVAAGGEGGNIIHGLAGTDEGDGLGAVQAAMPAFNESSSGEFDPAAQAEEFMAGLAGTMTDPLPFEPLQVVPSPLAVRPIPAAESLASVASTPPAPLEPSRLAESPTTTAPAVTDGSSEPLKEVRQVETVASAGIKPDPAESPSEEREAVKAEEEEPQNPGEPFDGVMESFPLAEAFSRITIRKYCGILAVKSGQFAKQFFFYNGRLCDFKSDQPDEIYVEYLIEKKLLQEHSKYYVPRNISMMQQEGILIKKQVVEAGQLGDSMRDLALRALSNTLKSEAGTFRFVPLKMPGKPLIIPIMFPPLIRLGLSSADKHGDLYGFYGISESAWVVRGERYAQGFEEFGLLPAESLFCHLLARPRRLDTIVTLPMLRPGQVLGAFFALLARQCLRVVDGPDESQLPKLKRFSEYNRVREVLDNEERYLPILKKFLTLERANYYEVLEIPEEASIPMIEKAYNLISHRFNPSGLPVNASPDIRQMAQMITAKASLARNRFLK
jgi:CheY-like chemotaxis protein